MNVKKLIAVAAIATGAMAALPSWADVVNVSGETAFSVAPGGSIGGESVLFGDCVLTADCDWRGLVETTPTCTSWMTTSADRLVWANTRLADLTDFSCELGGKSMTAAPHSPGFCTFNDGETAHVQFRHFSGGTIWCVKVTFTQVGDDVYGKAVYAKFAAGQASIESVDFDGTKNVNGTVDVATSASKSGYGVHNIAARKWKATIKGGEVYPYPNFVQTTATCLWKNVNLADITDFYCDMGGASMTTRRNCPGFCTSNDGETADVQFRYFEGGVIWCVKVRFTQNGDDVYGQAIYAKYATGQASIESVNFDTGGKGGTVATSLSTKGYGTFNVVACNSNHAQYFSPIYPNFATTTKTLYWQNTSLAYIRNFSCTMDGSSMSHVPWSPGFCTSNDGGTANVQFRNFSGLNGANGNTMCVKVVFTQEGDDVYGQASYAKYAQNQTSIEAVNFDNAGTSFSLATSSSANGYGALTIRGWGTGRTVDLGGHELRISGCGSDLARGLAVTNSAATAARLRIDVDGDVEYVNRWTVNGNVVIVKDGDGALAIPFTPIPAGVEVNAGSLDAAVGVTRSAYSITAGRVAVADGASLTRLKLLDGATLDVGGRATPLDATTISFDANAEIVVDTGTRTFARKGGTGEKIVAWSAAPTDGASFTPSGTPEQKYTLEARADGLYAVGERKGTMVIVE